MVPGAKTLLPVLLAILLAGCEAKLRLDGVEATKAQPVRRTDQFQSAVGSEQALVAVASHGVVVASTDHGKTWRRHDLAGWPSLIDIDRCPDGQLVALSYEREIWLAPADGSSWERRPIDTKETPQALTCDPTGRIWVVGSFSTFLSSTDRGATWQSQSLDQDLLLTTIQFLDADHAVSTGEFGTVATTEDGGKTWRQLDPIPEEFYPADTWFRDTQRGWSVGLQGRIYGTRDGGASWQLEPTPTLAPLYSLAGVNGAPYAVGGEGVVLRLDGDQWKEVRYNEPSHSYLRALAPAGNELMVAGGAGSLRLLDLAASAAAPTQHEAGQP